MKPTPGPWHVDPHPEGAVQIDVCSWFSHAGGEVISVNWIALCDNDNLVGAPGENEANARLISAAPDLLAALKDALKTIEAWHGPIAWQIYLDHAPEMKRIRAAIDKAEERAP